MPVTILKPAPAPPPPHEAGNQNEDSLDLDSDDEMELDAPRASKRSKLSHLVTPGELVTDDPQWMRYVLQPTSFSLI